jgi:hypothetical protein
LTTQPAELLSFYTGINTRLTAPLRSGLLAVKFPQDENKLG